MISAISPCKRRWLTLFSVCALSFSTQLAAAKEEPIDLSILEQKVELQQYMSTAQYFTFIAAEKMLSSGNSDIKSGEHMIARKPSALNPNMDLTANKKRGEALVKQGQGKVSQAQAELVALLLEVDDKRVVDNITAQKKFNFTLPSENYDTALEHAVESTLQACWDQSYKHVFFDKIYFIKGDVQTELSATRRNAAYDALVKVDGMHFSVSIPLGLEFKETEDATSYAFQFENSAVFDNNAAVLLAIEIIVPDNSRPMLSMRTLDLQTLQLVSNYTIYLSDAQQLVSEQSDKEKAEQISNNITEAIILRKSTLIDNLSNLASPYHFELTTQGLSPLADALSVQALLTNTLVQNSKVLLIENDFVKRTYINEDADLSKISNTANATIQISKSDAASTYNVTANAHGSSRIIDLGSMELQFPQPEESTE